MKQTRDNAIAPGGIFWCLPVAEAVLASFKGNAGVIKTADFMQADTAKAEDVVVLRKPVDDILGVRCRPEVDDPVIVSDHIEVVNLIRRPTSLDPAPRDTMSQHLAIKQSEREVWGLGLFDLHHSGASDFASVLSVPSRRPTETSSFARFPFENSGLRIVVEQTADIIWTDVSFAFGSVHANLYTVPDGCNSMCVQGQGLNDV